MVAKFKPTRFGNKNVFFSVSHVPSPTCNVFEEYELLPGGANCGEGDIIVTNIDGAIQEGRDSGEEPPAVAKNAPSDNSDENCKCSENL